MRFLTLLALALLSAVATALLAAESHGIQLSNTKAAGLFIAALLAQPAALWAVAQQALGIALVHLGFLALIYLLAKPSGKHTDSTHSACLRLIMVWAACTWLLLRANAALFPHSIWSWFCQPLFEPVASRAVDALAAYAVLLQCFRHLRALNVLALRSKHPRLTGILAALLILLPAAVLALHWPSQAGVVSAAPSRNIIVIGLDSLRRDIALGNSPHRMPHLAAFREKAYVQANVVTPLARTFPAWTSILTGLPPERSGARENLAAQAQVATGASFAWNFKAHGYRTVFATDETRFSNIGAAFGFDEVIAPRAGVPDFLLGQFSDQPLVNMLIQIPGAERLLPSLVGNRALGHSYRPQRFLSRLESELGAADNRSTLLAVHLCLAHWPFQYVREPGQPAKGETYLDMLEGLDQQFGDLLALLKKRGYLDEQTLVVVLSDHGESLTDPDAHPGTSTSQVPGLEPPIIPTSGHGASLLDRHQWEVFALFRGQSAAGRIPQGRSDQIASLADIHPTLLALSGSDAPRGTPMQVASASGIPDSGTGGERRYVRMETGFRPAGFDLANPDKDKAAAIAQSSFNIMPDGRVEMRDESYQLALQDKDYGITDGRAVLSLVRVGGHTALVSDDLERRQRGIYPLTISSPPEKIPLLAEACGEDVFATRLKGWCDPTPATPP